ILYMETLRQTTERDSKDRLIFGDYRLDKVYKDDMIVRETDGKAFIRYTMIMTDVVTNKSIKCYVLNKEFSPNIRIQAIDYCGVHIYDTLPDLVLRRVVPCENLTKYIIKLTGTMLRKTRVAIWETILNVLTKDIKLI